MSNNLTKGEPGTRRQARKKKANKQANNKRKRDNHNK